MFQLIKLVFFCSLQAMSSSSESENEMLKALGKKDVVFEEVLKDQGVVWGFDFLDSNQVIYTLRKGELKLFEVKTKKTTTLKAPKVISEGQGGLLDVRVKKIKEKTYLYITFSEKVGDQVVTSLARSLYQDGKETNFQTLFQAKMKGSDPKHFGSRILFHDDYLFMTMGDRGERDLAQNLNYHNGSIIRLKLNGEVPKDNPFYKQDGLKEIWSYGHRNPQGIDLEPRSHEIYSVEFGPRGGDELNLIKKGENYGWPKATYGYEYWGPKIGKTHVKGTKQPIIHWTPSISPSGMCFYRGDKVKEWKGDLFLANLATTHIRRVVFEKGKFKKQQEILADLDERFRHVSTSPDGYLYASTDSGKLLRIIKVKSL